MNRAHPNYIDRAGQLADQWMADPLKVEEADSWLDGTFDGEHYSEVERTLADLHRVHPSDLSGSDVLVRLYRLARIHGEAREQKLMEMAEQFVELDEHPSGQFMRSIGRLTGRAA